MGTEETQSGWRTVTKNEWSEVRAGKMAGGGSHRAFKALVRSLGSLPLTRKAIGEGEGMSISMCLDLNVENIHPATVKRIDQGENNESRKIN